MHCLVKTIDALPIMFFNVVKGELGDLISNPFATRTVQATSMWVFVGLIEVTVGT